MLKQYKQYCIVANLPKVEEHLLRVFEPFIADLMDCKQYCTVARPPKVKEHLLKVFKLFIANLTIASIIQRRCFNGTPSQLLPTWSRLRKLSALADV